MSAADLVVFAQRVVETLGGDPQPDAVLARRMQALSLAVHIPIVCFGIAFPAMFLFVEGLYLRTGDATYKALSKRWSKVALVLFAVGVITELTLEQAAADDAVLGAVLVSMAAGALILAPALWWLYRLTLQGRLDHEYEPLDQRFRP